MSRGLGTAMQVLAGAFGGGATSLGRTGVEERRLKTTNDMEDRRDRHKRMMDLMDFEYARERDVASDAVERDRIAASERIAESNRQARLDEAAMARGLSPDQYRRIIAHMEATGDDWDTARIKVLVPGTGRRGTPFADPAPPRSTRTFTPPPVATPPGRPGSARPGGVDRSNRPR